MKYYVHHLFYIEISAFRPDLIILKIKYHHLNRNLDQLYFKLSILILFFEFYLIWFFDVFETIICLTIQTFQLENFCNSLIHQLNQYSYQYHLLFIECHFLVSYIHVLLWLKPFLHFHILSIFRWLLFCLHQGKLLIFNDHLLIRLRILLKLFVSKYFFI